MASPFVPFSPFFSGSCPRSSFNESVSVTVLGKNCHLSVNPGDGIFIFFSDWGEILYQSYKIVWVERLGRAWKEQMKMKTSEKRIKI